MLNCNTLTKLITCSLLGVLIMSSQSACVNMKSAVYFDNIHDSTIVAEVENLEPVIQNNDLLSISIASVNPEASQLFNTMNGGTGAAGYLVNQDGTIQIPLLGTINAAGKSKKLLREEITNSLSSKKLLLEPVVDIRYLNYKITVLGEVASPGVITVPSEKITLLEALGMAGDLTINAKRNNVLVIRENNGAKIFKRINLNNTELFTSPYYYLMTNDIVYVEPSKTKVAGTSRFSQVFPIVISSLSFVFLIFDRLVR